MRKTIGLHPFLPQISFFLRPNDERFHSMLAELGARLGWRATATVLGVSYLTMDSWRRGKNGPSAGARKLVWLNWSLVFQPENVRSLFDICTWGKFVESGERDGVAGVLGVGKSRAKSHTSMVSRSDEELSSGPSGPIPMASTVSKDNAGQVEFAVSSSGEC